MRAASRIETRNVAVIRSLSSYCAFVGRHAFAKDRRKPSLVLAAIFALMAALFYAAGGDAHPLAVREDVKPVVDVAAPCCVEIVLAAPTNVPGSAANVNFAGQSAPASRWRVAARSPVLPIHMAPERGLQVRTILTARSISAAFLEIRNIGGVRPDALRWHPEGLALDVMIPIPGAPRG